MASRFVVLVALFALCHSNPVDINGIEDREGRALIYGQSQSTGSGSNLATASVTGQAARAYGNNAGDGANPGQATAQVYSGNDYTESEALRRAQHLGYYNAPSPVVYQPQYYSAPGYNRAVSAANTSPLGSSANSYAQSSNDAIIEAIKPDELEAPKPAVIVAKTQNVPYPARKSISWRFGTAYDQPAGYVVRAVEAPAIAVGQAALKSHSQTQGQGNADATAQQNGFNTVAASRSQSTNTGSANSDSSVGPYGSVYYRNSGWNAGRLASQTRSTGNANSAAKAQNLGFSQTANSAATSFLGGSAAADSQSY